MIQGVKVQLQFLELTQNTDGIVHSICLFGYV